MSEKKLFGDDLTTGLGTIFSRIGEFFHIFDLSYVIAGAITFCAFLFLYVELGLMIPSWFPFKKWEGVAIIIVSCYVCGLVAYASGRILSDMLYRDKRLGCILEEVLKAHGLNEIEQISKYCERKKYKHLYTRMWCEMVYNISEDKSIQYYYQNLIRYWAMTATYDGVAFAFIVWTLVLMNMCYYFWSAVSLVAAFIAFRGGYKYYEKQIEDVVAYYAMKRMPLL